MTIRGTRSVVNTVSLLGPHAYHSAALLADGRTILIYKGLAATSTIGVIVEGLTLERR